VGQETGAGKITFSDLGREGERFRKRQQIARVGELQEIVIQGSETGGIQMQGGARSSTEEKGWPLKPAAGVPQGGGLPPGT